MPKADEKMPEGQKEEMRAALIARGKSPTKRCPRCGETKDRSTFGVRKNGYSRALCKECNAAKHREWTAANPEKVRAANRRSSLRRWFGITEAQYDALLTAQDAVCAICGGIESGRNGFLYVDHCHVTGRIRGLLCQPCNSALGMMRDDPGRLRKAIGYLESPIPEDALHAKPGMPSGNRPEFWALPKREAADG